MPFSVPPPKPSGRKMIAKVSAGVLEEIIRLSSKPPLNKVDATIPHQLPADYDEAAVERYDLVSEEADRKLQMKRAMAELWRVATVHSEWRDAVREIAAEHLRLVSHFAEAPLTMEELPVIMGRSADVVHLVVEASYPSIHFCFTLGDILTSAHRLVSLDVSISIQWEGRFIHDISSMLTEGIENVFAEDTIEDFRWDVEKVDVIRALSRFELWSLKRLRLRSGAWYTPTSLGGIDLFLPALEVLNVTQTSPKSITVLDVILASHLPSLLSFTFETLEPTALLPEILSRFSCTLRHLKLVMRSSSFGVDASRQIPSMNILRRVALNADVAHDRLRGAYPLLKCVAIGNFSCTDLSQHRRRQSSVADLLSFAQRVAETKGANFPALLEVQLAEFCIETAKTVNWSFRERRAWVEILGCFARYNIALVDSSGKSLACIVRNMRLRPRALKRRIDL